MVGASLISKDGGTLASTAFLPQHQCKAGEELDLAQFPVPATVLVFRVNHQ